MSYLFAFKLRTSDVPGNPLMIKGGTLDDRFDPKALDSCRSYNWHTPVYSVHYGPETALNFPNPIWLNTGERKLDFDFRIDLGGLILSEKFVVSCGDALTDSFKLARLNVVNRKGASITTARMFYAKPQAPQFVVNREGSRIATETVQTGLFPVDMEVFRAIALRSDLVGEIVSPIDLDDCILIDRSLAERLKNVGLKGLELIDPEMFCERYNDRMTTRNSKGQPVPVFG